MFSSSLFYVSIQKSRPTKELEFQLYFSCRVSPVFYYLFIYLCLYFIPEISNVLTDNEHIFFLPFFFSFFPTQFLFRGDRVSLCSPGTHYVDQTSRECLPSHSAHIFLIDWQCVPLPLLFTDQVTTCCTVDIVSWVTETLGCFFLCLSILFRHSLSAQIFWHQLRGQLFLFQNPHHCQASCQSLISPPESNPCSRFSGCGDHQPLPQVVILPGWLIPLREPRHTTGSLPCSSNPVRPALLTWYSELLFLL
jgi:hypothetical protein